MSNLDKEVMAAYGSDEAESLLNAQGWRKENPGAKRSNHNVVVIAGFDFWIRRTPMSQIIRNSDNKTVSFSNQPHKEGDVSTTKGTVDNTSANSNTDHIPRKSVTKTPKGSKKKKKKLLVKNPSASLCVPIDEFGSNGSDDNLPALSNFEMFPSLQGIRSDKFSLVIGFDTEWFGEPRQILSWQFAVIWSEELIEFMFIRTGKKLLNL